MSKTNVFQDAFNEFVGKPKTITIFGREWAFKSDMPYNVKHRLLLLEEDPTQETKDDLPNMLGQLLDPPSQLEELLATNIGSRGLSFLLRVVVLMLELNITVEQALELVNKVEESSGVEPDPKAPVVSTD